MSKKVAIKIINNEIIIKSKINLEKFKHFDCYLGGNESQENGIYTYQYRLAPLNAFVTKHFFKSAKINISKEDIKAINELASKVPMPTAKIHENKKHITLSTPSIKVYKDLLKKLNAYPDPKTNNWRISITKAIELEELNKNLDKRFPKLVLSKDVLNLNREPIIGYDGTIDSLKEIPIGALNIIKANTQSYSSLKKSKKSIEEKIGEFGIRSLYDLLFWLPRRYIDKSKPQDISDLIEGEVSTIIGRVVSINSMLNSMGVFFQIETSKGKQVRVSFFRQNWLKNLFKVNDEVIITGKVGFWQRKLQLNGSSIEHFDENVTIPIIPIYNQSEAKNITTNLLMNANKELLSRLGEIKLPAYLRKEGREEYYNILKEVHFPTSLENHYKAVNQLAYYELIYMQLIVQEAKELSINRPGIPQEHNNNELQQKALKSLPFELTQSQKTAIKNLNNKLAIPTPSITLLNAEVGSGKTLVAQFACLKSVDSGYQALLLGPTEVLSQQLYNTFQKLVENVNNNGANVRIGFLSGKMKAAEKRELLKKIKNHEIDIIVGTHSAISDKVEYANLGFVAIDEQQKFGAEQRTKLLNSRPDGLIPDVLMMTATPIPRSTAQVFYGDIDMIMLTEKPPGRLPIETIWIQEDPTLITEQLIHPLWNDITKEAKLGNQTFVISPLVSDSTKIDSASVENSYANLKKVLTGIKIGYVHGQMKHEEQQENMRKFRDKEYDVLVASTVVEVGVDIPDATRVIILSADRLGASSLHQIRGRVGRNSKPSKCYLVSLGKTENSQLRLQSLVDSENGFDIAKTDLKIRGEGKLFGTEQSGTSEMIFANIQKHSGKINDAVSEAISILNSPFKDKALKDAKEKFNTKERLL